MIKFDDSNGKSTVLSAKKINIQKGQMSLNKKDFSAKTISCITSKQMHRKYDSGKSKNDEV